MKRNFFLFFPPINSADLLWDSTSWKNWMTAYCVSFLFVFLLESTSMTNCTVSRYEVTFGLLLFCKTSRRWRRKPSSWDRPSLKEDRHQMISLLKWCCSKGNIYQKEYLGTRSFPNTTDVTNSLEYSMASSLGKHRKELNYVKRTWEERKKQGTN